MANQSGNIHLMLTITKWQVFILKKLTFQCEKLVTQVKFISYQASSLAVNYLKEGKSTVKVSCKWQVI
jgi:hypothetical protein